MNILLSDLRYGLRKLSRTPGATGMVLLALSLGIGVSALTFSLIHGAILPVLPVDGGERIVRIQRAERVPTTAEDYVTWSAAQRSFESIGAAGMSTVTLAIDGSGAVPVPSASITPSILTLLSTEPVLGRPFTEDDAAPGAPAVVLIGHELWRERMDSSPAALGAVVRLNGQPAQVVGVMPEGFGFPWDQEVWTPLHLDPLRGADFEVGPSLESRWVVGRLRDDVSAGTAARELTEVTRQLDTATRGTAGPESRVTVVGYTDLFSESGRSAALAILLLGVAFLVLLVACANVANVLLARAIDRSREVSVRLAVGASRRRIVAQHLTEISILAAAGAAGGVGLAMVGTRFVDAAVPPGMPYWIEFRVDATVLGMVAGAAVLATLLSGLLPALQASRANTHELLKDSSRGSSSLRMGRLMRRLVGVEIALSFVLLVLAGLFIRSAANFQATEFAFEPEEVYTARIRLPEATYVDTPARVRFAEELRETLARLPQVSDVALATAVPGVGSSAVVPMQLEGAADADAGTGLRARSIVVTPGFFELFHAPISAGRDFDSRDRVDALPVAIVNEAFAMRHFPEGALDRRIRHGDREGEEAWLTIVGVIPDLMAGGVDGEIRDAVYLPLAQNAPSQLQILVRPMAGFASVAGPIRESLTALDPDVALFDTRPLEEVIASANSQYTWFSAVFLVSGGIALFLAGLGLYGVMSFWVVQRTREIGIRMALGGRRGDIVRLVLTEGMGQTSKGLAAGLLLAVAAAGLLRSALFGVAPYDVVVFGTIVAVLVGAAWLGCWFPARRATRMDPLRALGAE
jgi:putative ABC transport system permease protein